MNDILLCNYMEKLRYARKITQESFVDNVISLRQYKRYRNGESPLPLNILVGFSEKLGMSAISLLTEFEIEKQIESRRINRLYNSVANGSLDEACDLLRDIDEKHIIDNENRLYFKHSKLLLYYKIGRLSLNEFVESNLSLIDYPKILDKSFCTEIEILVISSLLDFNGKFSKEKIAKKMEEFLISENSSIMAGANDYLIPLILVRLSKHSGSFGDFDAVVRWCTLGVERSQEVKSRFLLEYFYYYLSLVSYKRLMVSDFEFYLYQCFNVIYLDGGESKIKKFTELIENDFGIQYQSFMMKYINKKIT